MAEIVVFPEKIEVHDAHMESLVVTGRGVVIVHFAQLAGYVPVRAGHWDIHGYEARLEIVGVTRLVMLGELDKNAFVMDGKVIDSVGAEMQWGQLLQTMPFGRVEFSFLTGAAIRIRGRSAKLQLIEDRGKVDEFSEDS